MKQIKKYVITLILCCLAAAVSASFSGNYLCVRRGGVTYKHKLYTSTTDVGSPRMGVRVGGATRYIKLLQTSSNDVSFLRTRFNSVNYKAALTANLFAIEWGSSGTGNGQFGSQPSGIAVNSSGDVFVVDGGNNRVQKFNSSGTYISQWGSSGTGNGQFNYPCGIAIDSSGSIYVGDWSNNRVQKFNSSGTYISKWGVSGTGDGQFNNPCAIAIDSSDNVYVLERNNNRVQKFNSSGAFIAKWGSYGTGNGQFRQPTGITIDSSGNVYVADWQNKRIQKFSGSGTYLGQWAVTSAYAGGPGGLSIDRYDRLYVGISDEDVQEVPVKVYTTSGTFITSFSSAGYGLGQLVSASHLAFSPTTNNLFVSSESRRVVRFD